MIELPTRTTSVNLIHWHAGPTHEEQLIGGEPIIGGIENLDTLVRFRVVLG